MSSLTTLRAMTSSFLGLEMAPELAARDGAEGRRRRASTGHGFAIGSWRFANAEITPRESE